MRTNASLPAGRRAVKRSARKRGYTNIETGLEGRLRAKLSSLIRVISEIRGRLFLCPCGDETAGKAVSTRCISSNRPPPSSLGIQECRLFWVFEKPCSVLGILYVQLGPRPKSIFTNKYAGQTKILGSRPLAARGEGKITNLAIQIGTDTLRLLLRIKNWQLRLNPRDRRNPR